MKMFGWMALFIFFGIGGFGFHVGVANLFVAGIAGVVSIFLNLLFVDEDYWFFRCISNLAMYATLIYGIIVATNTALQMYF